MALRNWINTFGQAFHLHIEPREDQRDEPLREYQQLAFGFQLDADGVKISGLCEAAATGTVLVDRSGPLLRDSEDEAIPAVALAHALSPEDRLQVPATAEADLLLRALPLPATGAPPRQTAQRPYSPLRLRK